MPQIRWHARADGVSVLSYGVKAHSYARLCGAVSRLIDLAHAHGGAAPGSAQAIALAEARTDLDDTRIAWWIGHHIDHIDPLAEIDRNGLRIAHADPDHPGSIATAIPASHPCRRYW